MSTKRLTSMIAKEHAETDKNALRDLSIVVNAIAPLMLKQDRTTVNAQAGNAL
ncbi:hypothetical protein KKC97_06260 [bacterium]|nr:hypothetical protein [bacterium]MBU1637255.1 hypothetical protein [bacterium]MBU1920272.1 hypothetical protein [bacterium]